MSIPKINTQAWLSCMKKKTTITNTDEKKEYGAEERYLSEKARLTGEFRNCGKV